MTSQETSKLISFSWHKNRRKVRIAPIKWMYFQPDLSPVEIYGKKGGVLALAGFWTETTQSRTWSGYNPEILQEILH